MTGGPLIDSGGNFVGMNFYSMDRTPLLPSNKIVDFLVLKRVIKSGTEKTLKRKYESRYRSKIDNEGPEVHQAERVNQKNAWMRNFVSSLIFTSPYRLMNSQNLSEMILNPVVIPWQQGLRGVCT